MNKYELYQHILDNSKTKMVEYICIVRYTINNNEEKEAFIEYHQIEPQNSEIIQKENNYPIYVFEIESYDYMIQLVNDSLCSNLFDR